MNKKNTDYFAFDEEKKEFYLKSKIPELDSC